ncbi:MAG TPA: patatin-like phospholipase family protein [Chloroflexota bacterium]|nr:patatin-like phospholipase family protein [Chloroflexota bacterium]
MFRRFRRGEAEGRETEGVVGYAFSGGGSRGASQVGALKALTEAGIWPQLVAGTSAGAVNAAWFAVHPHRLDQLEAIWLALRTRDVSPGSRFHILMNLARRGYVHRADAWEAFLRQHVGDATFEDAVLPLFVTAVRLSDGERVVFDSGPIVPALMASTAIPGVFPPYRIGEDYYVDGGVLEYMPLPTLLERGATSVFALDCSSFDHGVPGTVGVVDRCARISARASVIQMASFSFTRGRTVHLLLPNLPEVPDGRDFGRTAELVLAGYLQAREYLATHGLDRRLGGAVQQPTAG